MKKITYITVCFLAMSLMACNEYLEQMPDDRTVIDSPEKVQDLLVTAYVDATCIEFCEAMSDNSGDKSALAPIQSQANQEAYYWQDATQTTQGTPQFYWHECYYAISAANDALAAIEKASVQTELTALKGEALVSRAYHHFMLVNLFSLRYNPITADDDLGIPYVTKPENVVYGDYERKTVAYVYKMIQADLEAGLPLINDDIYNVPKYHFTESAAYAFASRLYLTIGEWEKAINAANRVLGVDPTSNLRDWAAYFAMDYYTMKATYTASTESANVLLMGATTLVGRNNGGYRFGLTPDLNEEIFGSSVCGGTWLYKVYGGETSLNIPKFQEYFKYTSINASTGTPFVMIPLFTMEEVLFNRMEANVMLGNFSDMIADVNRIMSKRIRSYDAELHTVTASSFTDYYRYGKPELNPWFEASDEQYIYLKGVLDLKRKEFMQEGNRWFDVKRYAIEIKRKETSGKTIDILAKNDHRRAIQIPEAAITEGLPANPR